MWQHASASASAASAGLGTSRSASNRVTIACTAALSARPSPVTASFTSFGLYCATGTPARAAATSARPLACPTDIAVRALAWNSTRSTASADGRTCATSDASSSARATRRSGNGSLGGVRITPHDDRAQPAVARARPRRSRSARRRGRCPARAPRSRTRVRSYRVQSRPRRMRQRTNSTSAPMPTGTRRFVTGAPATSNRSTGSTSLRLDLARAVARPCGRGRHRGRGTGRGSGHRALERLLVRARPRATCRRRRALVSTSRSRFSTNWPISFDDTSASTPRPNCATLPVIDRSVATSTFVPAPSAAS